MSTAMLVSAFVLLYSGCDARASPVSLGGASFPVGMSRSAAEVAATGLLCSVAPVNVGGWPGTVCLDPGSSSVLELGWDGDRLALVTVGPTSCGDTTCRVQSGSHPSPAAPFTGEFVDELPGNVPLQPAELSLTVRSGEITLEGHSYRVSESTLHGPPELVNALAETAARVRRGSTMSARLQVAPNTPFAYVRQAVFSLSMIGVPYLQLAAGPTGTRGIHLVQLMDTSMTELPILTIHLTAGYAWIGRDADQGVTVWIPSGLPRDEVVRALVEADRADRPPSELSRLVVVTDDDVAYDETFRVLSLLHREGYPSPLLGGGPTQPQEVRSSHAPPWLTAPPAVATLLVPSRVAIRSTGVFELTGLPAGEPTSLEPSAVLYFLEDCRSSDCAVIAVRQEGPPILLGVRPRSNDPAQGWIVGRPVARIATYLTEGGSLPSFSGTWRPLARLPSAAPPSSPATPSLVTLGEPRIDGSLARPDVQAVMEGQAAMLSYCYSRVATKGAPGLQGTIVVAFDIQPDGLVSGARQVTSTLNSPEIEKCVVGRITRARFPAATARGVVHVEYPFAFAPSAEAQP